MLKSMLQYMPVTPVPGHVETGGSLTSEGVITMAEGIARCAWLQSRESGPSMREDTHPCKLTPTPV